MLKKEVFLGFIIGLITNIIGLLLYVLIFSKFGIAATLRMAYEEGFLGSLVALGAVLNMLVFFWFIKKRQDYRARGVLTATVLAALGILFYKVFL